MICLSSPIWAQSTPTEFADLSLRELYELDVSESSRPADSGWLFTYQYKIAEYEDYLDDDSSVSLQDVLWEGPQEPRTDANFPVVPTEIQQQVHQFAIGYQVSADWAVSLKIPVVSQSTDHISIVPGYETFTIDTDGLGDIVVSTNYRFLNSDAHQWRFEWGVSIPTGSIDEVGDTPREHGNQLLPFTMQLGSGTWDIPLEFTYQHKGSADYSLSVAAMLRFGRNDHDYRLGNHYRLGGRYRLPMAAQWGWFVGGDFYYSDTINGIDDALTVEGPFPFPASITNPMLYGGRRLSLRGGAYWSLSPQWRLHMELGVPVYQHLNGPQPSESWRGALTISGKVFD